MEAQARRLMAQLPYMRRYGRALTGSTTRADDLVTRCVEAALADPDRYELSRPDEPMQRRRLYALLNALFDAGMRSHNDPARSASCVLVMERIMRYVW